MDDDEYIKKEIRDIIKGLHAEFLIRFRREGFVCHIDGESTPDCVLDGDNDYDPEDCKMADDQGYIYREQCPEWRCPTRNELWVWIDKKLMEKINER